MGSYAQRSVELMERPSTCRKAFGSWRDGMRRILESNRVLETPLIPPVDCTPAPQHLLVALTPENPGHCTILASLAPNAAMSPAQMDFLAAMEEGHAWGLYEFFFYRCAENGAWRMQVHRFDAPDHPCWWMTAFRELPADHLPGAFRALTPFLERLECGMAELHFALPDGCTIPGDFQSWCDRRSVRVVAADAGDTEDEFWNTAVQMGTVVPPGPGDGDSLDR